MIVLRDVNKINVDVDHEGLQWIRVRARSDVVWVWIGRQITA